MNKIKQLMLFITLTSLLVLLFSERVFASEQCCMSYRRGYWFGGTDNYFGWEIEKGREVISSYGYNCGYGIGCSAGGVFQTHAYPSTHIYIAVTNVSVAASIGGGDWWALGTDVNFYHRDEVCLYMYSDYYEIMPLDDLLM